MYWDLSVVPTFWTYWKTALGPNQLIYANIHPSLFRSFLAVALMAGMLGFLAWTVSKRQWITLFFAAWFVIVLSPLLPLRDHFTSSYLTIPTLGFAMWGSWAMVSGWRSGSASRIAAATLLLIYLGVNVPVARIGCQSFYDNSQRIRAMIYSVVDLTASQPQKTILLKGVSLDFFWDSIWHRPFRLFNRSEVYLIREDSPEIVAALPPDRVAHFFISRAEAKSAVEQGRAVLFDVGQGAVRDITSEFR